MCKKVTLATLKAFMRKIAKDKVSCYAIELGLYRNQNDYVEQQFSVENIDSDDLGMVGVFLVGNTGDHITEVQDGGYYGYEITNRLGRFRIMRK